MSEQSLDLEAKRVKITRSQAVVQVAVPKTSRETHTSLWWSTSSHSCRLASFFDLFTHPCVSILTYAHKTHCISHSSLKPIKSLHCSVPVSLSERERRCKNICIAEILQQLIHRIIEAKKYHSIHAASWKHRRLVSEVENPQSRRADGKECRQGLNT